MAIPVSELEASIQKTVLLFNRLKSPEAVARIAFLSSDLVKIVFSGSFCYDCGGVQLYIEAFSQDFKVFSTHFALEFGRIKETSPRSIEVDYKVKTK
jgi:hypothetical protein